MAFSQLKTSVAFLPSLMWETAKLDILTQLRNWEAICAYLTIYHWYDDGGPSLAESLFEEHRLQGFATLQARYLQFARLVDHIVRYIWLIFNTKSKFSGHTSQPTHL
jgi:hypothetical protein